MRDTLVEISFSPFNVGNCVSLVARMITRKWWYRLTDTEWDIKEPLKATSSLSVTTLSVPTSKLYNSYTCRAWWRGDYDLRLWTERFRVRVSAAPVWHCVLGQDISPACALSQPRSERVYLVGQ